MIDSGTTASCILDSFATRHGLSRHLNDIPVPIMVVDDCPIASELITQDVLTNISIGSHSETQALAVVAVSYLLILGLDWLQHHNPHIYWAESHLTLKCCGSHAKPTMVYAKGSSHAVQPYLSVHSFASVGLGFGLSSPLLSPLHSSGTG